MTSFALFLLALAAVVPARPRAFVITSPSFAAGAQIPKRHTCDGGDVSPRLEWSGAPARTRSFALIVDDPDAPDPAAPRAIWTHWVLYDLPPGCLALPEGTTVAKLPKGTREGLNDWKARGYRGPCPPIGQHRYFHRLYALDTLLPELRQPTRAALLAAMKGHVLDEAELVGTYARR